MLPRTVAAALVLAATLAVTACQPEPEPTPTGPAFASEDEAFAAAEETYRAYVDALNQVDLSDPATFEPVYAWTTGEANAGEKKSLTTMHADGWTVAGETRVTSVESRTYDPESVLAVLAVCTDVSNVQVLDREGVSVVAPERPAAQASVVTLEEGTSPTNFLIAEIQGGDHEC